MKSRLQEVRKSKLYEEEEEEDENYLKSLKQELMYDHDLLVHMKGEMDEMISILEQGALEEEHFEEHEEEEQVIDNRYFNKEVI